MFRINRIKMLILFLGMVLTVPPSWVHASEQEPIHVLLIYDSLAKGTFREGNVETLQQLLAAYGTKVTLATFDSYKQGDLQSFTKVIGVRNAPDLALTNQEYIRDFEAYKGNYLHIGEHVPAKVQLKLQIRTRTLGRESIRFAIGQFTQSSVRVENIPYMESAGDFTYGSIYSGSGNLQSPYGVRDGGIAYVPYLERGNISELAIAYVLKDWLAITEQGKLYLVFKEIYPFSDLTLLRQLADKLYYAGIPFIVSVRPVFSNTEYPAMKRYLETLKYVQSRNGSILVHAPVVATTVSPNDQSLKGKMASFVDVLTKYGIAPLGIGTSMYWSYDQLYAAEGMGFFDSGVLFPDDKKMYRSQVNTSRPFASSMYSMQMDFLQQFEHTDKAIQSLPMDTAITYDFLDNGEQLDQIVQRLVNSWITFADYKYESHQVLTENTTIRSLHGNLLINGSQVDIISVPKDISSAYTYTQETVKSFSKLFSYQNKIFIVIIAITLLVFGFLFIIGYRLYKRKYYK